MSCHFLAFVFFANLFLTQTVLAQTVQLKYRPAPADNPLKGLVPYEGQGDTFPHSMEFWYFPMNELMTGPDSFDWNLIEGKLNRITSRNCQAVIRVFMEYPGQPSACPEFLVKQGVKITKYRYDGDINFTPDYNDERTRVAMNSFIVAFGKKYDGDPRIGFITMGILGHWGEWHTYPRGNLFASKKVQTEIMDAFESAFSTTKILMRYPAGPDTWGKAPNHLRPFGYHDDSFAWATLTTGRDEDDWFFQPAMESAGPESVDKWKTQPIGGEIRPEVWGCVFDDPGCAPKGQEFEKCVAQTHVSWLMDSGMFQPGYRKKADKHRDARALRQIQKMGYEFYVRRIKFQPNPNDLGIEVTVTNRGVAPFYYDWPIEMVVVSQQGTTLLRAKQKWKITRILPGAEQTWKTVLAIPGDISMESKIFLHVLNPMPGGKPLRFANVTQADDGHLLIN